MRKAALLPALLALLLAACSPPAAPTAAPACAPPRLVFSRSGPEPPSAALIRVLDGAHERIDAAEAKNPSQASALRRLEAAGVSVKVNTHAGLMHLKIAVIDGRTAVLGSYNWTTAADRQNDEVLAVYECQETARAFEAEFERLWSSPDFADFGRLP